MTLETALLAALPPGEHHVELCKPDGRVWLHRLEKPYKGANFNVLACRRVTGDSCDWLRNDVPDSGAFDRLAALFACEPTTINLE
ncbi:MAG TPA: hypothetical protein VFS02_22335 [Telluria sp.]|nr:hypothetical protein [Telluria sp.]